MGKHHPARKGSLIIGSYKPPEQIDNPKNYNNKTITTIHPAEEEKMFDTRCGTVQNYCQWRNIKEAKSSLEGEALITSRHQQQMYACKMQLAGIPLSEINQYND
jgi:hypothetical protein